MRSCPTFAVLIYTEHEPESLAETLRALAKQDYPQDGVEVIVIDPADDQFRRDVAAQHHARYIHIKDANQPTALNEALELTSAEYIVITDDDCLPDGDWLMQYETALRDGVILAGGPDRVPGDARRFLKYLDYVLTSFAGSAGLRTTGRRGSAYYPRHWNMAFARLQVVETGGLDGLLTDGWELALAYRLRAGKYKVRFVSRATVWHQRDTNLSGYLSRNIRLARLRARMPSRRFVYGAPAAAALCTLGLAGASIFVPSAGITLAAVLWGYAALLAGSGVHAALTLKDPLALGSVPMMIFLQHLTHALGYWGGLYASGGSYVRQLCRHFCSGSGV